MVSIILNNPQEVNLIIAKSLKNQRLFQNLSQHSLSEQSGVSLGTLKKFERTGQISLLSLLKLALVLGCLNDFTTLFSKTATRQFSSLDELLESGSRKRGQK